MPIKLMPAYDHLQEVHQLFSEYTDMLINGDSTFANIWKYKTMTFAPSDCVGFTRCSHRYDSFIRPHDVQIFFVVLSNSNTSVH